MKEIERSGKSASKIAPLDEFKQHEAIYQYANSILKRTRLLDKKLHTIRRSIPWKLAFPLRLIENLVRSLRCRSREREVKV